MRLCPHGKAVWPDGDVPYCPWCATETWREGHAAWLMMHARLLEGEGDNRRTVACLRAISDELWHAKDLLARRTLRVRRDIVVVDGVMYRRVVAPPVAVVTSNPHIDQLRQAAEARAAVAGPRFRVSARDDAR